MKSAEYLDKEKADMIKSNLRAGMSKKKLAIKLASLGYHSADSLEKALQGNPSYKLHAEELKYLEKNNYLCPSRSIQACANKTPTEFYKEWKFSIAGEKFSTLVHPISLRKRSGTFKVFLKDLNQWWDPPIGIKNYEEHKDKCWKHCIQSHRLNGSSDPEDRERVHVSSVNSAGDSVEIKCKKLSYSDIVATTHEFGLLQEVSLPDGNQVKVSKWISMSWNPADKSTPYPPSANPLIVNTLIRTSDDKLLISKSKNPHTFGILVSSSSGHVNWRDQYSGKWSAEFASWRETKGEISHEICYDKLCWLGFVLRYDKGWFVLLGLEWSDLPSAEIIKNFEENSKKAEVKDLRAIEFNESELGRFLKDVNNDCGEILPVHVKLALEFKKEMESLG